MTPEVAAALSRTDTPVGRVWRVPALAAHATHVFTSRDRSFRGPAESSDFDRLGEVMGVRRRGDRPREAGARTSGAASDAWRRSSRRQPEADAIVSPIPRARSRSAWPTACRSLSPTRTGEWSLPSTPAGAGPARASRERRSRDRGPWCAGRGSRRGDRAEHRTVLLSGGRPRAHRVPRHDAGRRGVVLRGRSGPLEARLVAGQRRSTRGRRRAGGVDHVAAASARRSIWTPVSRTARKAPARGGWSRRSRISDGRESSVNDALRT